MTRRMDIGSVIIICVDLLTLVFVIAFSVRSFKGQTGPDYQVFEEHLRMAAYFFAIAFLLVFMLMAVASFALA